MTESNRQPKVVVLDDEAEIRALLERFLSEQGFLVRTVSNPVRLDRLLQREPFDVLILDLMMPGEDGLSVCKRLRADGETIPIIMLTARGNPNDRILGLDTGADDYLAKPFTPRELVSRIHALLRRQAMVRDGTAKPAEDIVHFGPFSFNIPKRTLDRNGANVPLSSSEFLLLKALTANPHRQLGRERLRELSRGRDSESTDRSIDVQILRLRRLIEDDPANPAYIRTVWGVGYVFIPEGGKQG